MSVDSDNQRKIERLDGIGVSYWGYVGYLVRPGRDINLWIKRVWEKVPRPVTPSKVADTLAKQARQRWGGLHAHAAGESVGFHVTGYEPWKEGGPPQPVIYHVHNGHGAFVRRKNPDGTFRVDWVPEPPREIEAHRDFPDGASKNCRMSPDDLLETAWHVRNGDFYITAEVLDGYLNALRCITAVDQYRKEPLALPAREALLRRAVKLAVRTHKKFTQRGKHVTVGGEVVSEIFRWPQEKGQASNN